MMYQLVASPFRNALGAREKRLILGQSWLKRAIYGELSQRVLPLRRGDAAKPAPAGMLLQNVIALVRYQPPPRGTGNYEITQVYLGVTDQVCVESSIVLIPQQFPKGIVNLKNFLDELSPLNLYL